MRFSATRGKALSALLRKNLRLFAVGSSGRARPIIWGVSPAGVFVDGMTLAAFLARAGEILRDSGRAYVWHNDLVLETRGGEDRLLLLAADVKAEPAAVGILTNLFAVGVRGEDREAQSLVPAKLVQALLADEDLRAGLPRIDHYARRPLFDMDFTLCGPGWHPERGVLVHGPEVVPTRPPPVSGAAGNLDRLQPCLRALLGGFCWASDADLVNAVALLLTGLLANHFIDAPKPVAILDGNQKGVGKTLFVQAVGHVLDDAEPPRIPLVRDEELEKKLCAQLRDGRSSLFFFDNVRQRIDSPLIEANALSPLLSFRILGQSGNITRPNAYLWLITSNQTSGTEDFISRGLPIRLQYDGDPRERTFGVNPLDVARGRRLDVLGELVGMVEAWKAAGRPLGRVKHRCARWAEVVGGILEVGGLVGFLANVDEAEEAMDEGLQALATLAEHVVGKGRRDFIVAAGAPVGKDSGALPRDWTPLFGEADLFSDKLVGMNPRGRHTFVGTFLSGKTKRSTTVTTRAGVITATLRQHAVRGGQKRYHFEVSAPDAVDAAGDGAAPADPAARPPDGAEGKQTGHGKAWPEDEAPRPDATPVAGVDEAPRPGGGTGASIADAGWG